MEDFSSYHLSAEMLRAIKEIGFVSPTKIQQKTIPYLLENETDFLGQAHSGTGKTAAFGIPLLEKLNATNKNVQSIILAPTRELTVQISIELRRLGKYKNIRILPVYGGQDIGIQIRALKKKVQIVVGTPGRILDHIRRNTLDLWHIRYLILDEADEMLDRGFREALENILHHIAKNKHTWLFSATVPLEIRKIADRYMTSPYEILVNKKQLLRDNIAHRYYVVSEQAKLNSLCHIIKQNKNIYGIVFCRTRVMVAKLAETLRNKGYNADCLHGDMTQFQRDRVMQSFRAHNIDLLVATDIAARGLDIDNLTHVINYCIPRDFKTYVHRIGRTGRVNNKGVALTFALPSEKRLIRDFVRHTNRAWDFKFTPK